MKGRIFAVVLTVVVLASLFLTGQPAQASIQPVMAMDNVFTALNSGEVDAAVSLFAENAIVENRLRRERYVGATEIRQMLQGMQREGRQFDIVGAEMYGDTIIVKVDVSDRGIVWGTETVVAQVKDGKLQTFDVTDFRLHLWG